MGRRWEQVKSWFSGDSSLAQNAGGMLAGITPWSTAPRRGTPELLRAYKRLPYLHSLSRRVAEEVASVPFQVLGTSRARKKSLVQARGVVGLDIRRRAIAKGELTPLDGHPFLDVLTTFNPAIGAFESRVAGQLFADLIGQVPLVRENDMAGRALELWPIPPHWVAEMPRPDKPSYRVAKGTWNREILEEAMVWGRVVDPENPYDRGTSYGEALGDELDVSELRARYVRNFFHNDAKPSGIAAIEGAQSHDVKRLEEEWNAKHQGPEKAGRIRFTNGKTTFTAITQTLQQMQMAESRNEDRALVQEVLNFPPELMGVIRDSSWAAVRVARYLLATGVIVPRLERWVSWLQPLADEYGDGLVLAYENPIPEDEDSQRAHMVAVPTAFSVNEHRRRGGAKPLEGDEGEALFSPPAAAPAFPVGLSAGDPPWAKSLPRAPARKALEDNVLAALRAERLSEEVVPIEEGEFARWADEALRELGVSTSFDMRNPLVRQALDEAGKRIHLITDTTAAALRSTLQVGVLAGEGIPELTARVAEVFNYAETYRSERIARTETVGLSNAANLSAWEQSGVVDEKEWLAIDDGRSGERHHERMDGQRVKLLETFRAPSGKTAQHPGGFGVAEEDINCRCAGRAIVLDPTKSLDAEQRKAMGDAVLKARVKMEDALTDAFRRGFAKQREDVLAALRSSV